MNVEEVRIASDRRRRGGREISKEVPSYIHIWMFLLSKCSRGYKGNLRSCPDALSVFLDIYLMIDQRVLKLEATYKAL